MKEEPSCVRSTLEWCNRQRIKRGKQPISRLPKGRKGEPESCPCGKATGLLVGSGVFSDANKMNVNFPLPLTVQRFVNLFDNGKLPQYVDHKAERGI